jgi:hypothetical protein
MLTDMAVLKDYGINDFSADNASPPEEILGIPVKLLISHNPAAPVALHRLNLLKQTYSGNCKSCTTLINLNNIKWL